MPLSRKQNIINWILGNLLCMLGIAFSTKANFGLSMIASIPYILHVWLRDIFTWFTQGTAEYVVEAIVLVIGCIIIKNFKFKYLLTIGEGIFVGYILDGWLLLLGGNAQYETMPVRIIAFCAGMLITTLGVAFYFRTDLPVQTYDFVVMAIAATYGLKQPKVKLVNDFIYLASALILSLALTRGFTGIGFGTVIVTCLNSTLIAMWLKLIDKIERKNN